jgi:hypothetical protein
VVYYKNVPLFHAKISFLSEDGRGAADEIRNGKFTVTGVSAGENVKVVIATTPIFQEIKRLEGWLDHQKKLPAPSGVELDPETKRLLDQEKAERVRAEGVIELKQWMVAVPPIYESEESTPLIYTIKPGSQELEIELEDR